MGFYEILDQVVDLLRRRGRVTYRALKREFQVDEAFLEDLKAELITAHRLARDEQGEVLVWAGEAGIPPALQEDVNPPLRETPAPERRHPEAERRQLTVLFCDLADSTRLARQLDPEDLREVMRAYQATCVDVLQRFAGYVAQYLGDGLLVYFGYPQAHEDDTQRAVRTGLDILEAIGTLNTQLTRDKGVRLAVRMGIHTGLVVVGEMGSGDRHEHLALGDTPNLAARLQGLAALDTVVISEATYRLVQGYFTCQDLGTQMLKGIDTPARMYQVVGESATQSRLDVAEASGLTPFVGREAEVTLLRERWAQSTAGLGQVMLLSGEAGIGKSRLVRVLTEAVVEAGTPRLTLRCSPYHTNSALYPVIEYLQRLLQWHRDTPPGARLATLERVVQKAHLPLTEVVPLLATLLSLPVPERYPSLLLSPQRQKQQTQEALVAWLLAEAVQQPALVVWEDLHWADPSTLELLGLLLDQIPTTRLLMVLTCRLEFRPSWAPRSYITALSLSRITCQQIEEMVLRVTGGTPLPAEVVQQIVAKTDGIPLFVEELTKLVLESGLVTEGQERYALRGPLATLAIPATLHDALMARLDRLGAAKPVAQLGATLGRQFAYEVFQAVAELEEPELRQRLVQLVDAELLYQRGVPPQATYTFKHALIQDAAYQSLLRSTRQQYHQRIAQVLAAQFADLVATQPELLAHHYAEAGLVAQAIPAWQQAGQRALERSANVEAVQHLTKALELLKTLPETPERSQHELRLQTTLGLACIAAMGYGAPAVERAYARARELCQQDTESLHLFPVLSGLATFYTVRAELQTALELSEQQLRLAERAHDRTLLLEAQLMLGAKLFFLGRFPQARLHFERSQALYNPAQHRALAFLYGQDRQVVGLSFTAVALWYLGYPDQALARITEAGTLADELAHPFSLAFALCYAARLHEGRREKVAAQQKADTLVTLCTEQGFPYWWAEGRMLQGWVLGEQGDTEAGIPLLCEGLDAYRATGAEVDRPYFLALLAEAYRKAGQAEAGLRVLTEGLAAVHKAEERDHAAELYRLKGELLRQRETRAAESEACFQQALAVARQQQAKSLELRAAMSLSRLWQQQGKRAEACELLAPIYGWFTEGLDTADLQEAKALLGELGA